MENLFTESSPVQILEGKHVGKDWDVVLIEAGMSKNGNFYSVKVLKDAVKLFEGLKACAYKFGTSFNHLPANEVGRKTGSFSQNVVGWFENARFEKFKRPDGSIGEGIVANFHVMAGAQWLRDNLKDAFENGKHDILGFSIDAQGQLSEGTYEGKPARIVERIDKVNSTDVVSEPAAGGRILRLVASVETDAKKILEMVKSGRPQWMKGFKEAEEGQSDKDFLLRILESNLKDAQQALSETELDSDPYKAIGRGAHKIAASILFIKTDKFEEGLNSLNEMLSTELPSDAKITDLYSFKEEEAESDIGEAFDKMLKSAMKASGMSTKDIAKKTGMTEATVTAAIGGRYAADDQRTMKVARAVGVDPSKLTENNEETSDDNTENEMEENEIKEEKKKLAIREAVLLVKECLSDSKLPENAKDRIKEMFEGKEDVTKEAIEEAIKKEEDYIASFKEAGKSGKVEGLGDAHDEEGRVEVTKEQATKIEKAWDGLFEGRDVDNVPMFTGLKNAWGVINKGKWASPEQTTNWIFESLAHAIPRRITDHDFDPYGSHSQNLKENWGQVISKNLQEATTTSSFSVTFGQALYRRLQKEYTMDPRSDWRKIISSVENLQDATNTFTVIRLGGFEELPTVNENAPYQELPNSFQTEEVEVITPDKKGGLIKLTWEAVLADKLGSIRRIPRGLAQASNLTIHKLIWGLIESNTVIQGNALISTANGTLVTGSPVLSYDAVNDAVQLIRDQTDQDTGEKLGLRAKFLLTGTKLENEAWEIVNSDRKSTAAEDSTLDNILKGKHRMEVIDTIGLGRTDGTDDRWYVMSDPRDVETIAVGFLGGRDRPDIFVQDNSTPNVGSMFDADAITFKVRLVVGATLVDFRGFAGSLFNV